MSNNSSNANEVTDWEAKYKRALADLANLEKDSTQRNAQLIQFAHLDLLKKLIPLYESVSAAANHNVSFEPIQKQFSTLFESCGVKRMVVVGSRFDPLYHEAVDIHKEEEAESHTILEEVAPGYLYHDKVLKPAKVIVST